MSSTAQASNQQDLLLRVQELQARLDATADRQAREIAEQLLAAVVQMYGAGLQRILTTLGEDGEHGQRLAAAIAEDDLVAALLLIHDIHPTPLHQRVLQALERVRPYMESHGGNVELLELRDGVAKISLRGSCSDCAASAVTLELAIEQALEATAPDLEGLEVEGAAPPVEPTASGPSLPPRPSPPPSWIEADHLDLVPVGKMVAASVGGADLLVANVDGTLLAYANSCASCGASLDEGALHGGTLACPHCARTYFLPRAGRSLDDERLQLAPFPLLREDGRVKVAVAA
jgi:Fe-S cluster biogenesis protein NfuA/nitrite reductase/ring-hydroxylating ferredoxin subunit